MSSRVRFGITAKITALVVAVVFFSVTSMLVIGYNINFKQVDRAAGEELIGCANITTGLIDPEELLALINGRTEYLAKIQREVDWTVDHKPIFKNASIMTLDGRFIAVDKRLAAEGFQAGDTFYVDPEAIAMIKEMRHPAYSKIYSFAGTERKSGYAPIFRNHDPNDEIIALMVVDFDASVIRERTWDMLRFTVQTGGIFPVLSTLR